MWKTKHYNKVLFRSQSAERQPPCLVSVFPPDVGPAGFREVEMWCLIIGKILQLSLRHLYYVLLCYIMSKVSGIISTLSLFSSDWMAEKTACFRKMFSYLERVSGFGSYKSDREVWRGDRWGRSKWDNTPTLQLLNQLFHHLTNFLSIIFDHSTVKFELNTPER